MIFLLELREFNEGSRRSFDQQQVLLECIITDIKLTSPLAYQSYIEGDCKGLAQLSIEVTGMESPWNTVADLKRVLLSDPTSKSREKFVKIVESLFNHTAFLCNPYTLQTVFSLAATHALTAYPAHLSSAVSKKRTSGKQILPRPILPKTIQARPVLQEEVVPPLESTSREMSPAVGMLQSSDGFDASMFDDLMDAECDSQPWDYLDDWDTADAPLPNRGFSSGRSVHPLLLPAVGSTVTDEPTVHAAVDSRCLFRSITHDCEKPSLATEETMRTESACSVLSHATADRVDILPFPESMEKSVYARRTSFSVQSFSVLSLYEDSQVTTECAAVATSTPSGDVSTSCAGTEEVHSSVHGAVGQGGKRMRAVTFDSTIHEDTEGSVLSASFSPPDCCASVMMHVVSTSTTPTQHVCASHDSHTAVADSSNVTSKAIKMSFCAPPATLAAAAAASPCWDSAELDFDLELDFALDFAVEDGPVFELGQSKDVTPQDPFHHMEAAPLAPSVAVCRPTPKRPAMLLGDHVEGASPAKKRMIK